MSERQVIDCDGCPAKDVRARPLIVTVGRSYNGVEMEDDVQQLDLCPNCLHRAIQTYTNSLTPEQARAWLGQVRKVGR